MSASPPYSVTPWYAHDDHGTQARTRLLLISYHFPPDTAVGARRWEKLAAYTAEREWGLDVITRVMPQRPDDPMIATRLQALPNGVRIYQIPMAPLAIQRFETWVSQTLRRLTQRRQANVAQAAAAETAQRNHRETSPSISRPASALPGSFNRESIRWQLSPRHLLRAYWATLEYLQYLPWARQAVALARSIANSSTHLAVVSSGPPHMMHEAARQVSVATGIPLVMDMRDPWSRNEQVVEHLASPAWYHWAMHYERRAVERAALIVANTDLARTALQTIYPDRGHDIITVMNGADEDPLPPSRRGGRFVIAHAGTLYLDRDPRALFFAAARVIRDLGLTPDQFGLAFIGSFGSVGGYPIHDVVKQAGIEAYVTIGSALPHAQAMEFMAYATMLVTMSGSNVSAIPAKTFECIRFEAWLLALSVPGSATDLLLRHTDADVIPPDDESAIAAAITTRYQQHIAGVIPPRLGDDPRFSRRGQATFLLDSIEERKRQL